MILIYAAPGNYLGAAGKVQPQMQLLILEGTPENSN